MQYFFPAGPILETVIEESKAKTIFSKQKLSMTWITCRLQGEKSQDIIFSVIWYQFPLS